MTEASGSPSLRLWLANSYEARNWREHIDNSNDNQSDASGKVTSHTLEGVAEQSICRNSLGGWAQDQCLLRPKVRRMQEE